MNATYYEVCCDAADYSVEKWDAIRDAIYNRWIDFLNFSQLAC